MSLERVLKSNSKFVASYSGGRTNLRHSLLTFFILVFSLSSLSVSAEEKNRSGEEIYRQDCAQCHGPKGEGVAGKHDEPLYGDRSVKALARLIERTMPEDTDKKCSPEEALKVAAYIYDAFYSAEARMRFSPPRVELSRMTVRQYLNAAADLVGSFREGEKIDNKRGLSADYYNSRNFRSEKKVFSRIDPQVEFRFEQDSPDSDKMAKDEFSVRWRGSLIAEESGDYEFSVTSENGVRLWVNGEKQALIDAWVSSAGEAREHKQVIHLLGGRVYPIQLDFFKFKEKSASIVLRWKPPHGVWETIPSTVLAPARVAETLVVTTTFPADDSSVGYEKGSSVSKAWDQATTYAAIEIAGKVMDQLEALSGAKAGAPDREERLKKFCQTFAERAFGRPLSDEQKKVFIDAQFDGNKDLEKSVKRVVLLVLKSPRFLYPAIGSDNDDYSAASRLSFTLWDSLPDRALQKAAAEGKLRTREQIAAHAERMMKDARAKAKVKDFFHEWLNMEEAEDISKDTKTYPDFNEHVMADLRTSLHLFIDSVVWSESSDYRQLMLADYLYLNDRLAKFFGLKPGEHEEFQRVSFDPNQRAGVVTHPYLLTTFAYYKNSSPIHRGVFLTRNVLGRSLKPPPMAIEFMDNRFDPSLTMREKVTELTSPNGCQSCHSVINPLGFSLEHFDAVGRFRTTDNEKPVNAVGEYITSDGETVRLSGARDVAEYAARSPEAHRGFIQHLFQQMVKQPVAAYGPNTLEELRRFFADSEFNIQKLLVEIARISAMHGINET